MAGAAGLAGMAALSACGAAPQPAAADVHKLALKVGIVEHVSLGAIPTAVPHTAPTPIMMTAATSTSKTGVHCLQATVIASTAIVARYMRARWVSWMSTSRSSPKGMKRSRHAGNCSPQAR